ncbi:J domain-containing protein [Streptacidiphilus sp. ASG 303]|uniref:J domain-containing protein n=1 Tax=Streptacidiphilus sp. ASG 303 TaxID=2896847 RepID=UPI001E4E428E|nr:J domain-containing protein [Streptacidiphilus sp. ASG 303]MCD0482244.1 J domain-containing protein [Streptacidiphilus sp. ASG 303]
MTAESPVRWTDPDEQALELKVAAVEAALVDLEIEVETLRVEIDNFALLHHQRLGPMYVHLDELEALIAEAVAARTGDAEDIRRAYEARSAVTPMPDLGGAGGLGGFGGPAGADAAALPEAPRRVRPSREVQRLYRDLARRAHPDLSTDPAEQQRRSAFVARVNEAYARGDEAALHALAAEWAAAPGAAPEPEAPDRTAWLNQRLAWLVRRIEQLAEEQVRLESGPMGRLLKLAPDDPDRLLEEIAEELLARSARRQAELERLLGPAG